MSGPAFESRNEAFTVIEVRERGTRPAVCSVALRHPRDYWRAKGTYDGVYLIS